MRDRSFLTALVFIVLLAGCAPYATYPPIDGTSGINQPHFEPVPTIMANAIRYTHTRFGEGRDFAINLPEGASARVYKMVLDKLGEGRPMSSEDDWTYYVQEIRSRGLKAQADIVFPRDDGPPGLITVHLRHELGRYTVSSSKLWNLPVEMPPPYYTPPVEELQQEGEVAVEANADE